MRRRGRSLQENSLPSCRFIQASGISNIGSVAHKVNQALLVTDIKPVQLFWTCVSQWFSFMKSVPPECQSSSLSPRHRMESAIGWNLCTTPIRPEQVLTKYNIFAEMLLTHFFVLFLVFLRHLCSVYRFTAGLRHDYIAVGDSTA